MKKDLRTIKLSVPLPLAVNLLDNRAFVKPMDRDVRRYHRTNI